MVSRTLSSQPAYGGSGSARKKILVVDNNIKNKQIQVNVVRKIFLVLILWCVIKRNLKIGYNIIIKNVFCHNLMLDEISKAH